MQNIYGNIQGIKASQIKQLQRLYEQRQPGDRLITAEFAQALAKNCKCAGNNRRNA